MVTVHRAFGFRFVIFSNDHGPAHVHVVGHDAEARVLLGPGAPRLDWMIGLSRVEARRVLQEVTAHQDKFLEAWSDIHG
jgi:hypothetical protein